MKKSIKLFSCVAVLLMGIILSSSTSTKLTKLSSTELNYLYEVGLKNAVEIGHVQDAEELLKIQNEFGISEELSYVRSYKEGSNITSVMVTLENSAYFLVEKIEVDTICGCFQNGNYHVTGDPTYCERACEKPGP